MNISDLKENTKHGTDSFPVALYDSRWPITHQWHNEDEFIYMVEGEAEYNINGRHILLKEGRCAFCGGFKLHSMITEGKGKIHFKALLCNRSYLFAAEDICNKYFDRDIRELFRDEIMEERLIIEAVKNVCALMEGRPFGYELKAKKALMDIYLTIAEKDLFESDLLPARTPQKNILSAIEYIHTNFSRKIYIDHLAELTGYSTAYFESFFKAYMGKTPSEYIVLYRLDTAKRLLAETDMSVTEIAQNCGFANVSYFIRSFRRAYRTTPYGYRKKLNT